MPDLALFSAHTLFETRGENLLLTSTLFSAVTGNGKLKYIAGSNVVEVFWHASMGHVTTCIFHRGCVSRPHFTLSQFSTDAVSSGAEDKGCVQK